jgi:hypothetical protein
MSQVPYTRLTTAAFTTLASTQLSALCPYQIRQVQEFLDRVNWGNATTTPGVTPALGRGSDSDVSSQPTIAQILVAVGANNP